MRRIFILSLALVLGLSTGSLLVRAQTITAVTWAFSPSAPAFGNGQTVSINATVTDSSGTPAAGNIYLESISGPLAYFYNNTAGNNQVVLNNVGQATVTGPALSAAGTYQAKLCYKQSASTGCLTPEGQVSFTVNPSAPIGPTQSTPTGSGTTSTTTPTTKKPPIVFDPEISIFGFSGGPVDSTTFAKYVRAIFIYFIWGVGVLAVVMVIFGGVRWVAAAGNPARINQAKDIVYNAIIGLVIALTSVVLLSLLDPKLVNFEGFSTITQVAPIPYEMDTLSGKFNEAQSCLTKGGQPIQTESSCFFLGTKLLWPVANSPHNVTSRIGPRNTGGVGSTCHPGTDLSTNKVSGQPILAPTDGVIQAVEASQKCGEFTMELHTPTFYLRFVHVKSAQVKNDTHVTQGQLIGYTGGDPNDGAAIKSCSGGPHLHVELYANSNELHDVYPCLQP